MLKHQENLVPDLKLETGNKPTMSNSEEDRVAYREADEEAQKQGGQRVYGDAASAAMIPPRAEGYRRAPIRESRIKDRPYTPMNDNLSIKIELDLEVEVDLYARVKGDVTIGLL